MKTFKRIAATLLLVCILASMLSVGALAADDKTEEPKPEYKISLSEETLNLTVGETAKLDYKMEKLNDKGEYDKTTELPNNYKAIWRKSGDNVDAVTLSGINDHTVTAEKAGSVEIIAKIVEVKETYDPKNKFTDDDIENVIAESAPCTVTVSPAPTTPPAETPTVPITGVEISPASESVEQGDSLALSAKVLPEDTTQSKDITWASSSMVVTVNSGVVTVPADAQPGEVTIRATSLADTSKYAECKITVTQKSIPVESVSISQSTLSLAPGKSATLTANALPENATDKSITWSSGNEAVASVDQSGKVSVKDSAKAGDTAIITAKANNGMNAVCTLTVVTPEAKKLNLTVSPRDVSLYVDIPQEFIATVSTSNNETLNNVSYTWSVTNGSGAGEAVTATNGPKFTVKATKAGDFIVTVKVTADGYKEESYGVNVKVKDGQSGTTVAGQWAITPNAYIISTTAGNSAYNKNVTLSVVSKAASNEQISSIEWRVESKSGFNVANLSSAYNNPVTLYGGTWAGQAKVTARVNGVDSESAYISVQPGLVMNNASFDGKNAMTFISTAPYKTDSSLNYNSFVGIAIDGKALDGKYFSNVSDGDGYTKIKVSADYLKLVAKNGNKHSVLIRSYIDTYDGVKTADAEGYFWTGSQINGVQTGDESNIALWAAISLMSFMGICVVVITRRKA